MTRRAAGPGVRRHRAAVLAGGAGVAGLALLAFAVARPAAPGRADTRPLISQAKSALQRRDFASAERLAARISRDDRSWAEGRLVAGEASVRAGRLEEAARCFAEIPRDGSHAAVSAALAEGEVLRELGRLSKAESCYEYVLEQNPDHIAARERLAFLLGVTGRRWESEQHFMWLLKHDAWSLESLVLLGDLERPLEEGDYLKRSAERAPHEILVRAGLAAHEVAEGRPEEAKRLLREIVASRPDLASAQAMLGELLVDGDAAEFAAWHDVLTPSAENHPDVWFVRGLWARRQSSPEAAARCFWEAVRIAPTHRRAIYQLGQVLVSLKAAGAGEFTQRAARLYELTKSLDDALRSEGRDERTLQNLAELTESAGRFWEARAWAATAAATIPDLQWPAEIASRLTPRLHPDTPRTIEEANLALRFDLSAYPDLSQLLSRIERRRSVVPTAETRAAIRFADEAELAGIDFTYFCSPDTATRGARMFEQTGGGVAAFDYDLDGRPDLYFPQGAEWKSGQAAPIASERYTDVVYRNVGGSFQNSSAAAGLGDPGFGQGCAAGDYDDDGFPDLYVANVGPNRLYRNNGDGTFTDGTSAAGLSGAEWTTSCVIVDLNADGFPDLYDVNYLTGPDIYEALCNGRACSPKAFDGQPDRLFLSTGDGTFRTTGTPDDGTTGKGLGVVAADIDRLGRPSLFIANDQVPSFFLKNEPADGPDGLSLTEEGFVRGLAFNEDGLPMAAMGIAADDADGDERLDLFVTTFADESSILYRQDAPGLFVDGTNAAGLRGPSLPYVGWGAQFLDADRDGDPDLVLTNGHVDDYRDEGGMYRMRPQFFRNSRGRFRELPADEAGEYFRREFLGRGLARLDWNCDGLTDFATSNIGDRASLVTNRSSGIGRFLNVRLHARTTARDAIGTVVEVSAGSRRWAKQLVAGDGYMASNERLLQFGLGDTSEVTEVRVTWPSGLTAVLSNVPADSVIDWVEGLPPRFLKGPGVTLPASP